MPHSVTVWVLVLFMHGGGMNHMLFTDQASCQTFLTNYTNALGNDVGGACIPATNILFHHSWTTDD